MIDMNVGDVFRHRDYDNLYITITNEYTRSDGVILFDGVTSKGFPMFGLEGLFLDDGLYMKLTELEKMQFLLEQQ